VTLGGQEQAVRVEAEGQLGLSVQIRGEVDQDHDRRIRGNGIGDIDAKVITNRQRSHVVGDKIESVGLPQDQIEGLAGRGQERKLKSLTRVSNVLCLIEEIGCRWRTAGDLRGRRLGRRSDLVVGQVDAAQVAQRADVGPRQIKTSQLDKDVVHVRGDLSEQLNDGDGRVDISEVFGNA